MARLENRSRASRTTSASWHTSLLQISHLPSAFGVSSTSVSSSWKEGATNAASSKTAKIHSFMVAPSWFSFREVKIVKDCAAFMPCDGVFLVSHHYWCRDYHLDYTSSDAFNLLCWVPILPCFPFIYCSFLSNCLHLTILLQQIIYCSISSAYWL